MHSQKQESGGRHFLTILTLGFCEESCKMGLKTFSGNLCHSALLLHFHTTLALLKHMHASNRDCYMNEIWGDFVHNKTITLVAPQFHNLIVQS